MSDKKLSEGSDVSECLSKRKIYYSDDRIEESIALQAEIQNSLNELKNNNCISEEPSSFEGVEGKDICIKIPGSEEFRFFVSDEPMYSGDYAENEKIKEGLCSPTRIEALLNAIGKYVKEKVKGCKIEDIKYEDIMRSKESSDFNHKVNSKGKYRENYRCQQGDWLKEITGWKEPFHVRNFEGIDERCFFWDLSGIYCKISSFADINCKLLIEK